MVLAEGQWERRTRSPTNCRPVSRLGSFRRDYIRNSGILKVSLWKLPICLQTRCRNLVYLREYIHLSMKTPVTIMSHLHHNRILPGVWVDTFLPSSLPPVLCLLQPEGHFINWSHASSPLILSSWIPIVLGIKKQILSITDWPHRTHSLLDSAVFPAFTMEEHLVPVASSLLTQCLSHCLPSRMFFPPSLFTCCVLFRFSAKTLLSWENRPDPREVKCSV